MTTDRVEHEYLVEHRGYTYTIAGTKLHLFRPGLTMTLCGHQVWQLVLVEEPVPDGAVCEWCLAASRKENP